MFPFNVHLVSLIYRSLHSSFLQTYRSFGRIIHSLLTYGLSVKSAINPRIQIVLDQKSSFKCGWELLWTLYRKRAPHLGGFNTDLYAKIATLSIFSNEELAEVYSKTMTIQRNIELSRAVISPNIIIERYLELLMSCTTSSTFLAVKLEFFTSFLSNHGNHYIYKSDNIKTITKFLENCNAPNILNPYSPSSNHPQS